MKQGTASEDFFFPQHQMQKTLFSCNVGWKNIKLCMNQSLGGRYLLEKYAEGSHRGSASLPMPRSLIIDLLSFSLLLRFPLFTLCHIS